MKFLYVFTLLLYSVTKTATGEVLQLNMLASLDEYSTPTEFHHSGLMTKTILPAGSQARYTVAPDWRRLILLDTRRREDLVLKVYMDGNFEAIGYGNQLKWLPADMVQMIRRQGNRISEVQADSLRDYTFAGLDRQIRHDLPGLRENQVWAVKSLAFNWGYGAVKKSALWPYLKRHEVSTEMVNVWRTRTFCATKNHRTSRKYEAEMWCAHAGAEALENLLTTAENLEK